MRPLSPTLDDYHLSRSPATFRNRICVVHGNDKESAAGCEYLYWFYDRICRIPVVRITTSAFAELQLFESDCAPFMIVFLLSSCESKRFKNKLLELNGRIPVVGNATALLPLQRDPQTRQVFGVRPAKAFTDTCSLVRFGDSILGADTTYPSTKDYLGHSPSNDTDTFTCVEPIDKSNCTVLATIRARPFATVCSGNFYFGQKSILVPREDLHLEFGRSEYYLKLLERVLLAGDTGYPRLKLLKWPIAVRIDDLPATTEQITRKTRIMKPSDTKSLLEAFSARHAKLSCAVVPSFIEKNGTKVPWTAATNRESKSIIDILRGYQRRGVAEIMMHGLTHATIGYDSYVTNSLWNRFRLLLFRPTVYTEFYDSDRRTEISIRAQAEQLELARRYMEEQFGVSPATFVPPAHRWDSKTESLLARIGLRYMSCDMNFYQYPQGENFRKNPSPTGEVVPGTDMMFVSVLLTRPPRTARELHLFNSLGIPLIWNFHNTDVNSASVLTQLVFPELDSFQDKEYMTISQVGDLLREYEASEMEATTSDLGVSCELNTSSDVMFEFHTLQKRSFEVKVDSGGSMKNVGSICLAKGRHTVSVRFI